MDCIFCKIIKGEIPCEKIYEDNKIIAFLDINPVNYGHTLVVPKEHYQLMFDLPDDLLSYCYIKTKDLMRTIKEAMTADYIALAVVGIEVPHFHIHLIPRYFADGLANFWPTKNYQNGEIEQFAEKIRKNLT